MPTGSGVEPDAVWDHPPPGGPCSSLEKGMTSPARPGQGPMGTNGWKNGASVASRQQLRRGDRAAGGRAARSPAGVTSAHHSVGPTGSQPLSRMLVSFLLGAHGGGTCRGQWRVEGGSSCPGILPVPPMTQLIPGARTRRLCSGAACLCLCPTVCPSLTRTSQPEASAGGSGPVWCPGPACSLLLPPGTSGLLQGGQGSQHPFIIHSPNSQMSTEHLPPLRARLSLGTQGKKSPVDEKACPALSAHRHPDGASGHPSAPQPPPSKPPPRLPGTGGLDGLWLPRGAGVPPNPCRWHY